VGVMGGLAIKKIIGKEGDRFSREEKLNYQSILKKAFGQNISFPVEIQEKETFGDLDVLVSNNHITIEEFHVKLKQIFLDKFEIQGFVSNSNIISYSIDNKQIDFIFTDIWAMPISYVYFSNNDFGNLLGRIARGLGLKFGHDGLHLPLVKNGNVIEEIRLSHNTRMILLFLGFSSNDIHYFFNDPYDLGFKTFEEMFEFVTRSKYFDGSKYDLDKLDQQNRIRNKKRKTYMNFIEWLNNNPEYKNKRPMDVIYFPSIEMQALEYFNCIEDYFYSIYNYELKNYIAKKFNGNLVRELTGFEGKELGNKIKELKNILTDDFIISNDIETIRRIIKNENN
jgi:hypothetical protein